MAGGRCVDYIDGGRPGSNPKDVEFFPEAKNLQIKHAKLAAFGSTRHANTPVEEIRAMIRTPSLT